MWWRVPVAVAIPLTVAVVVAGIVIGGRGGSEHAAGSLGSSKRYGSSAPVLASPPITVAIGSSTVGQPIRAGYLGLSIEFQAVRAYTGSDPRAVNPVLVALIRNLSPGQSPVLRIGGDSTDVSWVPGAGVKPPAYVDYRLTPSWFATTGTLARELGARMIMGLNLAANQPALAAAEARADLKTFGRGAITAFEIGNEPNVYSKIAIYHTLFGAPVPARARKYDYPGFRREFSAIAKTLPPVALAGPALAVGPTPNRGSWVQTMPAFLGSQRRVRIMTVHRYPLRNCYVPPSSPQYPTVSHLLSSYSTIGLADSLRRWVRIAHARHRAIRVDELNSVACRGKPGTSDTFASSLWAIDALFQLARLGVDGVNLHTLPRSAYELFAFSRAGGRWRANVRPVYYGLELFAQAAPPGSRLLRLSEVPAGSGVSVWATRSPDRHVRVVLINKDTSRSHSVTLRAPSGPPTSGATLERLQASGVSSRSAVTIGGRSYGAATDTGRLPRLQTQPLRPRAGGEYKVTLARASAILVTFAPRGRETSARP